MKLFDLWKWAFPVQIYQPGVAAAVVGSAVVGGTMASSASKSAAKTGANAQIQAAQIGADEQRYQFDEIQKLLNPFVNAATGANSQFKPITKYDLVDTSQDVWRPNEQLYANDAGYRTAWDKVYGAHQQRFNAPMRTSKGSGLDVTQDDILRSGFNLDAYNQAAQAAHAAKPQTMGSLTAQQNLIGLNGVDAQRTAIAGLENSPMMTALMQQGENGILQNASATGGLRGGNVQSALAEFRPMLLAQMIESQYAKLGGLTSMGQNSAAGVGAAGLQTGANISNLMQQSGAAQAGAALAGGKAQSNLWTTFGSAPAAFAGLGGFKGLGGASPGIPAGPAGQYYTGGVAGDSWNSGFDLPGF